MGLELPLRWILCLVVFLRISSALQRVSTNRNPKSALKQRLPFYHSSDELHEEMVEAVAGCNASVRASLAQGGANLDVVRLSAVSGARSHKQKRKALFIFGEHARELISAESAVHFVRTLCGSESGAAALSIADFVIVPNANPSSRRVVETGAFCKRTNEHGVDLNRNWGNKHRELNQHVAMTNDRDDGTLQEQNPGPTGFSEPETQALRDLAQETNPDVFLSVHSGAYLLGMPFGYSAQPQPEHASEMTQILSDISNQHCGGQCPYGNLESVIDYPSPGCAMDYVVEELKVPYAFTFEIYKGGDIGQMGGTDRDAGFQSFANGFMSAGGNAVLKGQAESKESSEKRQQDDAAATDENCLEQFNPTDEDTFHSLLDNWSGAYIDLVSAVDKVLSPRTSTPVVAADASPNTISDVSTSSSYRLEVDNTHDVSFPVSDPSNDREGDSSTELGSLDADKKQKPKGPVPTLSPEAWAKAANVSGPADDGHLDDFSHKLHDVMGLLHNDVSDDASEATEANQPNHSPEADAADAIDLSFKTQSTDSSKDALSDFLHPKF